jgi:hypothetical protein
MRLRHLFLSLLFAFGIAAPIRATWQKIAQTVSAFHFMPTGTGLIGSYDPVFVIQTWDGKNLDGVFAAIDTITNIIVVDSNVAWASVRRDGLFKATKGWKEWNKVAPGSNVVVVAVIGSRVFYTDGKVLRFYENGQSGDAQGIDPAHTVLAIDNISATLVAAAETALYRSTDNGSTWQRTTSDVLAARSVYADATSNSFYTGGDTVRKSIDGGQTWTALKASAVALYDAVEGQVVGSKDCSGLFYVSPVPSRGEILRSDQGGKFFHTVGPANFASISMRKGLSFNNASRFYWLDKSGTFSQSLDGVDGSVRDSAASLVNLSLVGEVRHMLCSAQPASVDLKITTPGCNAYAFDSIKVLSAIGVFGSLSATQPIQFQGNVTTTYRARKVGVDTAHLRTWFHSVVTGLRESKDFTIVVEGRADPAAMLLDKTQLDFGIIKPLATKTLRTTITNTGCDVLRIDSIVTTSSIYTLDTVLHYPFNLTAGEKLDIGVVYAPTESGPSVEALEIGSSAAHHFVKLKGTASIAGSSGVSDDTPRIQVRLFPNPARDVITINVGATSYSRPLTIFDPLGRTVFESVIPADEETVSLDLSPLSAGPYVLIIEGLKGTYKLAIAK